MNMDKKIDKENLDLFLNNYNKISKVLLIKSPTINFKTINVKVHKESGYMTYPPIEITTLAATIRQKLPNVDLKLLDAEYDILVNLSENKDKKNILKKLY